MNEHRNTAGFLGSIRHPLEVSDQELRTRPENMVGVCVSPAQDTHIVGSLGLTQSKSERRMRVCYVRQWL